MEETAEKKLPPRWKTHFSLLKSANVLGVNLEEDYKTITIDNPNVYEEKIRDIKLNAFKELFEIIPSREVLIGLFKSANAKEHMTGSPETDVSDFFKKLIELY